MKIIALFFPAIISISVYCKRRCVELKFNLFLLVKYIIYVMFVNWCGMALIVYIIKPGTCISDDMESCSFFTKYILIAMFFAWIIPYLEEIIKKYIHISFNVKTKTERE